MAAFAPTTPLFRRNPHAALDRSGRTSPFNDGGSQKFARSPTAGNRSKSHQRIQVTYDENKKSLLRDLQAARQDLLGQLGTQLDHQEMEKLYNDVFYDQVGLL